MKDLLIIFIVLLVLLLLISSYGGSLRYTDYVNPTENVKIGQESNHRDEKFTQDEDSNLLLGNSINNVNNSNIGREIEKPEKKQMPLSILKISSTKDQQISPYDSSEVYGEL